MTLKNIISAFIIYCLICGASASYAAEARLLSDNELDNISAAGFDINMDAVIAFRAAVINQYNLSAVSALTAGNIQITNSNFASSTSSLGAAMANQSNIGQIMATEGDIIDSSIDCQNDAFVNSPDPLTNVSQSNIAAMIAPNGVIRDSSINTTNHATLGDQVTGATVNQSNIIVLVATDVINTPVTYSNVVDGNIANAVISQETIQTHTFEFNGITGMININNATNGQ